jgi:aquaporin Z
VKGTATTQSIGVGSALLLEIVLTAVFVAVILEVTKSQQYQGWVFMAIALTLAAIHLSPASLTGASVNPGRTLGSAIIGNEYADVWLHIVGPLVGAAVGLGLHRLVTTGEVDNPLD